jgi:hypothetical protein
MPDEVVRLPKVSRAAVARFDREIDRPAAPRPLPGIPLSARITTHARCLSRFTRLTAMTREEVPMFNFRSDRSTNAFADLEAQLRALGASGDRLAEATTSLRASARIFAAASARLSASSARHRAKRPMLKLV